MTRIFNNLLNNKLFKKLILFKSQKLNFMHFPQRNPQKLTVLHGNFQFSFSAAKFKFLNFIL